LQTRDRIALRHGFNLRDETIAGDVSWIGSGLLDGERWDLLQNEFRCEQSCGLTEKKGATQRPDAGRPRDRCAHNFHSYKTMIYDRPDPNNINLGHAAYAVGLTRAFSINSIGRLVVCDYNHDGKCNVSEHKIDNHPYENRIKLGRDAPSCPTNFGTALAMASRFRSSL